MSGAIGSFVGFLCIAPVGAAQEPGAHWTLDLWITGPLIAAALLYGAGILALWHRAGIGRGIRLWQAGCYAAGWLVLVLALVSPVHHWGSELFAIHMVEHELVMAVAAPLLVIARPGAALAWACPSGARRLLGRALRATGLKDGWQIASRPGVATLLHGIAIWTWHAPTLFEAAIENVALHRLQHVSFLVTGVLFWWALLRRRDAGIAAAHLFVTMLHTSILGALVALAPRVIYRLQTADAARWGLTSLQDQQLAGLIMWIPAGLIYASAALLCLAAWIAGSQRSSGLGERHGEATF
jgi:cytochrome c oxidase assembly factor CtaG